METLIAQKQDLINWISTINDEKMIMILKDIKHKATFNFDEEFAEGISLDEFREKMLGRVRNYPWKINDKVSK